MACLSMLRGASVTLRYGLESEQVGESPSRLLWGRADRAHRMMRELMPRMRRSIFGLAGDIYSGRSGRCRTSIPAAMILAWS
jgi:hypothetical protein